MTLGAAVPVHAQSGGTCEELSSWTSPQDRPGGMTFEGDRLWVGSMGAATTDIVRLDPASGAPDWSIPAPGPLIGGLAWDGSTLWCLPEETGVIFQLDAADGTVLHSIPAPSFGEVNPNGADLAWDGQALWHVDYTTRLLYQLDPADGAVLQAFATPGSLPTGLAWSGDGLVLGDASARRLYLIDPGDGAVLHSCPVPGVFLTGVGVSADARASYADTITDVVREYDLGLSPAGPSPFTNYCSAEPNSTGAPAVMGALGSASVSTADLVLTAEPVPPGMGIFLYSPRSMERSFGFLCIDRPRRRIGRAVHSHLGVLQQPVDYDRLRPCGTVFAGSTWYFQAWYLDRQKRRRRLNATDGLEIVFAP